MLRTAYLNKDVKEFVNWLASKLKDKSLSHVYEMPGGVRVVFTGLEDALKKYDWSFSFKDPSTGAIRRGNTYSHNEVALNALQTGLTTSITLPSDPHTRDWSIAVMEWGGVRNGNVTWLQANVDGLADEINSASAFLALGNDDRPALRGSIRRFNSGMTKVYSLLVKDFIIYDSRVAAALAWLIVCWCVETGRKKVPDMLRFPCMRPKEGDNPTIRKLRNPSCDDFHFPWLSGPVNHAHWNIRASWVLAEALASPLSHGSEFHKKLNPLRALEAALFMWGYDLQHTPACKSYDLEIQHEDMDDSEIKVPAAKELWHDSNTRGGKAKEFKWRFDTGSDLMVIKREIVNRSEDDDDIFSTAEIFLVIHKLYDHFGSDWYPLANNVELLGKGEEIPGLGSAIYAFFPDITHAQAASQLGVILEELGIFEWNNKKRGIAWRLRVDPPATIDDLRMALC